MCICNVVKHYSFLRSITESKAKSFNELIQKASSTSLSAVVELILNAFNLPIYGDERKHIQVHKPIVAKIRNKKSIRLEFCHTFCLQNLIAVVRIVTVVLNNLVENELIEIGMTCDDFEGATNDTKSHIE